MTAHAAAPASAAEALAMLKSAMGYLAAADATAMAAETQAQCLQGLEQVASIGTAARASILGAFTAGRGYAADADYSPRAWLIHKTHVTKGAAAGHTAWSQRAAAHPAVTKFLAAGEISESYARTICSWTGRLPAECRDAADAILAGAAVGGLGLRDVAALAAELLDRYQPGQPDPDRPDVTFEDRSVRLDKTLDGVAVLYGDLTPECTAALGAVLEALSAPKGAGDTRSHAQRYHDALHQAAHRLLAAGLLPERAGQPAKAWVHVSLADMLVLEGSSALLAEWIARVRAAWAAHRAAASVSGSDGGAWLDGDAARAAACDTPAAPVVWGEVHHAALDGLVRLCVELARLDQTAPASGPSVPGSGPSVPDGASGPDAPPEGPDAPPEGPDAPPEGPDAPPEGPAGAGIAQAREALEQAIIGKTMSFLLHF